MTADSFYADFEQTLLKENWNFYHVYLKQLAEHLENKKITNYFTYYLGKTISRDDVLTFYDEVTTLK